MRREIKKTMAAFPRSAGILPALLNFSFGVASSHSTIEFV
jgi:hypothetical protein